jgi:hypothetical protein
MRSLTRITLFVTALVLAAAFMPGCEDSLLIAPADSDFLMVASPETLTIDEPGGETAAETLIMVQVFDALNYPMEGVTITFTASGGMFSLDSMFNDSDSNGTIDILDDDDANGIPDEVAAAPVAVDTNDNGVALIYLTVTLDDESTVEVTARSGSLSASTSIAVSVVAGNLQPEAYISVIPVNRQRVGAPVNFSGLNSIDPDGDDITCYKWSIYSSLPAQDKVIQGHIRPSITERFDEEQVLSVTLHVSDDPDHAAFCTPCEDIPALCGASDDNFSPYFDSLDPQYEIVCDLTDPVASAGSDQVVTLSGATVDVFLDGSNSSDPESSSLAYDWDCANGTAHGTTPQVTCTYDSAGIRTAMLTVTNDCGMSASDTVRITVNAP